MGYSVLLPVRYLSVVNSCPQNEKKIRWLIQLILFHLRLSTLERLRMFVMLYWIVGGVLSGGLTGGLWVSWSKNKILWIHLCTSECQKGFCSLVDPTGFLGRRIYNVVFWEWKKSLLHFQIKIGVVVCFSLLLSAYSRLCHCLFYVHVSTISTLYLDSLNIIL